MSKIDKTQLEDFKQVLNDNKYSEVDFELNERDLTKPDPNSILSIKKKVIVKCISTKKEKEYDSLSGMVGAQWVVDFEKDLKAGFFDSP